MRSARNLLMVPFLLVLGLAGVGAQSTPTSTPTPSPNQARTEVPSLDPDCVRFDDPTAVVNGEIVFAGYTAYRFALDHAVAAWSPERGFAVPFREAVPTDATVPPEANLIYRDVRIPGSGFKGVTVTWSHAPATVTLNLAALPPPETADLHDQERLLAVVTHETGHALGLGDVPTPGVNIRECANMLMKRSVDKGGGAFTEPQPGDIALYCMRWSAPICGNRPLPSVSPNPAPIAPPGPHPAVAPPPAPAPAPAPALDPVRSTATYRYFVVTCDQLPPDAVTPAQVEGNTLPDEPPQECARAPVGVLFRVLRDDGTAEAVLTDENGEFAFQKPDGVGAEVRMPGGAKDTFPPLVGYQPAEPVQRIPASDPGCPSGTAAACKRSFVLVPSSG